MPKEPHRSREQTPRARVFPDLLAVLETRATGHQICKRFANWPMPEVGTKFELLPHTQMPYMEVRGLRHRPELDLIELRFDPVDDALHERILNSGQRWAPYRNP